MQGRICLVTGATNGIGRVTARELARMGATVVIVGRSEDKTQRVVSEIKAVTGNPNVDYIIADLASMQEGRRLAADFTNQYNRLHVLINNAGAIFIRRKQTVDGYEMTFALNHLSYFLLTNLLLDTLKASGTVERKARIVNVSSDAHRVGALDFDNLQGEKGYNGPHAYGQSKLENIMFTYELARRLQQDNAPVSANVLHPGLVSTGFARNNGVLSQVAMTIMRPFSLNAEQGAQTSIYLATSPVVEDINGQYFEKLAVASSSNESRDEDAQKRLWQISEELTGLKHAVAL